MPPLIGVPFVITICQSVAWIEISLKRERDMTALGVRLQERAPAPVAQPLLEGFPLFRSIAFSQYVYDSLPLHRHS
jgi:hypothetical protein